MSATAPSRLREAGARLAARPQALLWAAALALILAVTVSALRQPSHLDTVPVWTALHRFLHGLAPYAPTTHRFDYDHPPGSTVVDSPLGLLSLKAAGDVIVLVSGLGAGAALWLMGRHRDAWRPALAALIVAASRPLREELTLGNLDLLSLTALCLGMVALHRRRERLGAVGLAVGVLIKPTAAPVLLAPLLIRRPRATLMAVSGVLAVTALGFLLLPESGRFFTSVVPFLSGPEQGAGDFNGSLTGLVGYAGLSIPAGVTEALALAGLAGLWLRYRREIAASPAAAAALLVSVALLVPRYSFEVYGLYLILGFAFLLDARRPLEVATAAIAVWFLTVRDVLPLHGAAVLRFRELRPGLGHLAVAVLIALLLERRRREAAGGFNQPQAGHNLATMDRQSASVEAKMPKGEHPPPAQPCPR